MYGVMCAVHTQLPVKEAVHTEIILFFSFLFWFNFKVTESCTRTCGTEFLSWHSGGRMRHETFYLASSLFVTYKLSVSTAWNIKLKKKNSVLKLTSVNINCINEYSDVFPSRGEIRNLCCCKVKLTWHLHFTEVIYSLRTA